MHAFIPKSSTATQCNATHCSALTDCIANAQLCNFLTFAYLWIDDSGVNALHALFCLQIHQALSFATISFCAISCSCADSKPKSPCSRHHSSSLQDTQKCICATQMLFSGNTETLRCHRIGAGANVAEACKVCRSSCASAQQRTR